MQDPSVATAVLPALFSPRSVELGILCPSERVSPRKRKNTEKRAFSPRYAPSGDSFYPVELNGAVWDSMPLWFADMS